MNQKAYKAITKAGYKLPTIEKCSFDRVLDCVVVIKWPGHEAMYSIATGKVVRPYSV